MSHNEITKPRNVKIGAMAAPLLVVGILVLFNGASDPRSSAADVQAPSDPESIIQPQMGSLSETQQAAIRFREQIPALTESDSPFPLTQAPDEEFADDPGFDQNQIDPNLQAMQSFMVTAMIASNAGDIALINGKAHRLGDDLGGGWSIEEIDVQAKQVVIKDAKGEQMTLGLNRPGPR